MDILRLKEILKNKGVTGKDLASDVGVTAASVSNIVSGNSFPKPELLKKIADVLDVDIRELFIPTKDISGNIVNGFIEHGDTVYKINSIDDIRNVLTAIDS